ncbi:short-chain dehydrogenase/reductase SDR [Halogeometricum pallidum JCM 14848]|uniref:Short-chain dehydrogenase/reductase SDR n=1 Tax=Halogeometricum pallidum JCM 14848 TaxID=1227487 RepID=M0DI62_HALPD|nr:SDR family NAD(P)-dependent oxidoreductase [Halogeometricum pallidum]ELZ33869.1 short-chain dehydrogenase/reductase SDR [Halogeometricum pallidum JCM 14848]
MQSSADARVVVLTGANEGIGYHMLAALLGNGYRVAGLDVNGDAIESLREAYPASVRYYECDVTVDADVEAAIEGILDEWRRIDILVNNAAILAFGFFEDQSLADARRAFEVNYFGYVRTIRAVLPHMRARNEGIIHNVSSGVGRVGSPGLSGYASTKGAVESLTRSLRLELRDENVACTILHPRLASTRSATALGYPESQMSDPAYVGRKLAGEIESTRPVIYTDWVTRIGLALAQRFPSVVERGAERFLAEREASARAEN